MKDKKKLIEKMAEASKKARENLIKKYDIPKDIMEQINRKTALTALTNSDNTTKTPFDEESFKLGMMSMYFYLKVNGKLQQ